MTQSLAHIAVSSCETFHLYHNRPLYNSRFKKVLKFHEPGLAPAYDQGGAFHITLAGKPLYPARYLHTFGFYEGYAAIETETGWGHIDHEGKFLYHPNYGWCGNYQEGACAVAMGDRYFHIVPTGERLYPNPYRYVGDFKEGIAVVWRDDGHSTHINKKGEFIHGRWYPSLDIFHKGFARAQDDKGWFHITKEGKEAYTERFEAVEPFYNGYAYAHTLLGDRIVINHLGKVVRRIHNSISSLIDLLSHELVSFWKVELLKLAVELNLFENLPSTLIDLSRTTGLPSQNLERILYALWEIDCLQKEQELWQLTPKGLLLQKGRESFMGAAALMWAQVQGEWSQLKKKIKESPTRPHLTFKEESQDLNKLSIYERALKGYAEKDFYTFSLNSLWNRHQTLAAFGQTALTLLPMILQSYPHLKGILLNRDLSLYRHSSLNLENFPSLSFLFLHNLGEWEVTADAFLLPRFLHYLPDPQALSLLQKISLQMPQEGKVYIGESILSPSRPHCRLLDLNMWAESGGKLRTLKEWVNLLEAAGLRLEAHETLAPSLEILIGCKE